MAGVKDYRIRIYKYSADWAGSTPEVEWTFTTLNGEISDLADQIGGQRITPLEVRAESLSWQFSLLDIDETITAKLADAEGNADMLRRIVDISESTNSGSSWDLLTSGRISDVSLTDSVASYEFSVQDERYIERTTEIFTDALPEDEDPSDTSLVSIIRGSETASVYPAGFVNGWPGTDLPPVTRLTRFWVNDIEGNIVQLTNWNDFRDNSEPDEELTSRTADGDYFGRAVDLPQELESEIIDDMREDVTPDIVNPSATHGHFHHLVVHIGGEYREVIGLDIVKDGRIGAGDERPGIRKFHVVWPTNQPTIGTVFKDVYFAMPTKEPTSVLRKHIEAKSPFAILRDIYDELGVRYDSTAMQDLIDDKRFDDLVVAVEGPSNAADWIEKNIYRFYGVVPMLNAAGEVAPKPILQPNAEDIPDVTTLTHITPSEASTHPTFQNTNQEIATAVEFEVVQLTDEYAGLNADEVHDTDAVWNDTIGFGLQEFKTTTKEFESGRVDRLGRHHLKIDCDGAAFAEDGINPNVAEGILQRFASGAIHTELRGLSSLSSVEEGDYVVLDISTYPNLRDQARGGTRLMQVLTRSHGITGPSLTLLDAGPDLQPLTKLTITATQNTGDPENAIDVDISGLDTGATWVLQAAESDTEPASSSGLWQTIATGESAGVNTIEGLKSDTTYFFRARQTKDQRVGSLWSDAVSASTAALTAPSGLQTQNVKGCSAQIIWTNGDADSDTEVFLDGEKLRRLEPGTTFHFLLRLQVSTTYTVGVRHVGPKGGVTSTTEIDFTTTATPETGPPTLGLVVLSGQEMNS